MASTMRMPSFIIAGAMRSGTTSMARWLGAHPEVFMSPVKEIHYFDRNYHKGPAWYAEHFKDANATPCLGEATPNYLYQQQALARIARDLPHVALVILLRDPADRAYSHYQHRHSRGGEDLSFEAAIEAEPERLRQGDDLARAHYSYVDRGRYLAQLRHAFDLFPAESLLIHLFEDLRDAPVETFAATATFLGVDPRPPDVVGRPANSYQEFRSTTLRRAGQHLPRGLAKVVGRLNRVDTGGYPPMSPRAREMLSEAYAAERQELGVLLGRDLSTVWT